jgi:hypothetical protein
MTDDREVARRPRRQRLPVISRKTVPLAGVLATALFLAAGVLRAQETSLTIYQDGRVVVRRTIATPVPHGVTTLPVDLGARNVDPGTLVALDDGVEIRGATVSAASGPEAALRRAVGQDLDFMVQRSDSSPRFVRATLLSLDPQTVRLDGRVLYGFPGVPVFPDSLVSLAPRVELTLDAARAQRSLRIAYQAGGLQWRASYALVVPRGPGSKGLVSGFATIEDPGALTFEGAEVQLLAGDVRGASPSPRGFAEGGVMMRAAVAPAAPAEEAVGETHLYTLSGTVDLLPGQSETVALFPRADVEAEPEYLLRHEPYYYRVRQDQAEQDLHAEVSYLVRRPRGTPFGDAPLPAGVVRVLAPDSAGRVQLLGEAQIKHTPAGRELHLTTGTAFDITAQRTQLTYELSGKNAAVSSYRVTIQNAKSEPVTVQVLDQYSGEFQVLSSSVPAERLSASSIRFPVAVPAGGEAALEYRVRARW